MKNEKLENIITLLRQRGYRSESNHVLSPDYVKQIILVTNNGKANNALDMIRDAEKAVKPVWGELRAEDREWYLDLLNRLRTSVLSSNEN